MDTTIADTLIGTTIDGRYRITGRVARGGMATVYTANDERLARTVALKIIHPSQATNVHFVDKFTDEAKTIARLTHPNVVAVYDQGRHLGLPYLVMEYVRGRTLRDVLSQRRRLNPVEALAIIEQMLAAIAAAHRSGLVHRDVKPENVLVAEAPSGGQANLVDAVVKVADFGLARAVEASSLDESGQLMATVAYVAPELVAEGHADARSDVYSAGIVLYEMLTGQVPFDGEDPVEVAWQHVDNDVPAPSTVVKGLPKALDDLVANATRRDPGSRPTDAGALLAAVQSVRDDLGAQNVETALLRQVPPARPAPAADATRIVPAVHERPTWARLPEQAGRPQPAQYGGGLNRGPDKRRIFLMAAVAVMVIVVLGTTWWVTLGRYTDTPAMVNMTKSQAELYAHSHNFSLVYGQPTYSTTVAKDSVVDQKPAPGARIARGGSLTLTLSLGPQQFPVPDLVGQELPAAKSLLSQAGLIYVAGKGAYSATVPQGAVISTSPAAGVQLKAGASVTVTASLGPPPITIPGDIVGADVNAVQTELQKLGLSAAAEVFVDSTQPANTVVAVSPGAGTGVTSDTKVTLQVSKGPPQLTMPDVTNQPCAQAQQTLQGMGLQVRVDYNPNGTVVSEQPNANSQIAPGSQVAIQCL